MKKFFLSIAIVMLNLCMSFANTQSNSLVNEQESVNVIISIELGDITDMSEADLYSNIDASLVNLIPSVDSEELTCTVKVSGSVGVGSNKLVVEVSVTGPCNKVAAEAKKQLDKVKQMIKDALS